jgi:hypothetical protein
MVQIVPRLLLLFSVGFITWSLVLLRNHAQTENRAGRLAGLIFCDEVIGITTGVFLARSGGASDVIAVASGGTVAAFLMMRFFGRKG